MVQITHNLNGPRVTHVCAAHAQAKSQVASNHACKINESQTHAYPYKYFPQTIFLTTNSTLSFYNLHMHVEIPLVEWLPIYWVHETHCISSHW